MENNNNEIKKYLLKQKPIAYFQYIRKEVAYYQVIVFEGIMTKGTIIFEVPVSDMGEADFKAEMPAQFLLRWINSYIPRD